MKCIGSCDRLARMPECLNDFISEDNPVRIIDDYVNSLKLEALGFILPRQDGRGRPSYGRKGLLKLYLYGYGQGIRTSRKLEIECHRNVEVMWLLGRQAPDHKTICEFRRINRKALKAVQQHFNELCRKAKLFGAEFIAVDGVKIKGQNAPDQNYSQTKLKGQLQDLNTKLQQCRQELEQIDAKEAVGPLPAAAPKKPELERKIEQTQQRQTEVTGRLADLEKSQQSQCSLTDPDSRSMGKGKRSVVGYNVQASADAKHHLLVDTEVTNAISDQGQLTAAVLRAKAALKVESLEAVADKGYFTRQEIKSSQEANVEVYVQAPKVSSSERQGFYGKEDFTYDPQTNTYGCPAGAQLGLRRTRQEDGKLIYEYENAAACANCPLRSRCTPKERRIVSRWEHENCLERVRSNLKAHPEKLAKRKELIEHCFGTVKWLLPGGFLLKGLEKVQAEISLAHIAYNMKRAIAVLGVQKLLEVVREQGKFTGSSDEQWAEALSWVLSRPWVRLAGWNRAVSV